MTEHTPAVAPQPLEGEREPEPTLAEQLRVLGWPEQAIPAEVDRLEREIALRTSPSPTQTTREERDVNGTSAASALVDYAVGTTVTYFWHVLGEMPDPDMRASAAHGAAMGVLSALADSVTDDLVTGRRTHSEHVADVVSRLHTSLCPPPAEPAPATGEAKLREVLTTVAAIFDGYADGHRLKGTPDGERKAKANAELAELCWSALATSSTPPASPSAIERERWAASLDFAATKFNVSRDSLHISRLSEAADFLRTSPSPTRESGEVRFDGVAFLFVRDGAVLLERCPKKAAKMGVGEWFILGGKIEEGETPGAACARAVREELGVTVLGTRMLPLVQASRVESPAGSPDYVMRPYVVERWAGDLPTTSLDHGYELRWVPLAEALRSPVPQVRMMVAAALSTRSPGATEEDARDAARWRYIRRFLDTDTSDGDDTYATSNVVFLTADVEPVPALDSWTAGVEEIVDAAIDATRPSADASPEGRDDA